MEKWVSLFDIFLNSLTPETEASLFLQQSFDASSSSPITTCSFISLLTKHIDAVVGNSTPLLTKKVMFMQTLPKMVQSRILSFLAVEHERFSKRDLAMLARSLLEDEEGLDFWVKSAARHLLDEVSDTNYEWISGLNLDSGEQIVDEEFKELPIWLKDAASDSDLVLPWLPISHDELQSRDLFSIHDCKRDSLSQAGESGGDNLEEMEVDSLDFPENAPLAEEIQNAAASLRTQIMKFESRTKTMELANEIRQLCLENGGNSFAVMGFIEPWKLDDEIASILISNFSSGTDQEELGWPSQVLSSIILPKMLVLEKPASRLLMTAMIHYCKLHQRAAEYALMFPLIMRIGGINNPICDVLTRIIKKCLHPVHVSAFCHKLLCGGGKRLMICLPCHQCLISDELVWTESLFNLFYNVLNANINLTQDSVDQLVLHVQELAQKFSKSLKFGNFLLCFITKCSLLLKSHKLLLENSAVHTNTLVTKSILSKLASF